MGGGQRHLIWAKETWTAGFTIGYLYSPLIKQEVPVFFCLKTVENLYDFILCMVKFLGFKLIYFAECWNLCCVMTELKDA